MRSKQNKETLFNNVILPAVMTTKMESSSLSFSKYKPGFLPNASRPRALNVSIIS